MRADTDNTARIDLGENLEGKIIRRAWQIMRAEDWVKAADGAAPPTPPPGAAEPLEELAADALVPLPDGGVAELVLDETTEPHFVIVEQKDAHPDEE